ncbi:MAG: UDP-N-acetylmuramoyl-L-alanyl-D-glutamate--2,6-diaminopimelate ligase [Myxococcota bacterium]|nr:UDP-N-acetylmuramoyl-L-alanyl-D-glutamate--2,6-diaminopimelate ligase [Myxococcota bacterium]
MNAMFLQRLTALLGVPCPEGQAELLITGAAMDSRQVRPDYVFIAVHGEKTDGHLFLKDAAARGARLLVVERPPADPVDGAVMLRVPDSRLAAAVIASALYGDPAAKMLMHGVTGTNGKTTTVMMLEDILRNNGRVTGLIGTVVYRYGSRRIPAPYTTPDALLLQQILADMLAAGCGDVVMEVSSHALHQHRTGMMKFRSAIFTNLTRDHLDYHKTMEAYEAAKARLFLECLAADAIAVINADDAAGRRIAAACGARKLAYSLENPRADLFASVLDATASGTRCRVQTPWGVFDVRLRIAGKYNVQNMLGALGAALDLGISPETALTSLEEFRGAPGRLEPVDNPFGVACLVDYAHTPDALENVCRALRAVTAGRLITVFGCGGDRDPGKRPVMGRIAVEWSDLAIITSDNPRTEDPLAITNAIEQGASAAGGVPAASVDAGSWPSKAYAVEPDRRAAISMAIRCARAGDTVLVAGKGHEDYQITGMEKHHFDDREEAARAFSLKSGETR